MTTNFLRKKTQEQKSRPEPVSTAWPDDRRSRIAVTRNGPAAASISDFVRNESQPLSGRQTFLSTPQQVSHLTQRPQTPRATTASYQPAPQQVVYQSSPPPYGNQPRTPTNHATRSAPQQNPYQREPVPQPQASYSQPNLPLPSRNVAPTNAGALHQGAALVDRIQDRMSGIISAMDGHEVDSELLLEEGMSPYPSTSRAPGHTTHRRTQTSQGKNTTSSKYFYKAWLYANSRLPPHLPPLKVYIPTYPVLCLAARYSLSAYDGQPVKSTSSTASSSNIAPIHIAPSLRLGTKAMLLALHILDTSNTVVLAIRGSATFADWAVNFRPAPASPAGFLDDPGNLVHHGFLAVAKAMVAPVAARLSALLRSNPARWRDQRPSLLLTGHSAGGAVASLLYAHLLSQSTLVASDLKALAPSLRRIHCVTFGAPPVSLLPLAKPTLPRDGGPEPKRWRKSMFFAFVNEGDPVVRADRASVRSLLALYAAPAPAGPSAMAGAAQPAWRVPPNSLSNAGRLVLLRPVPKGRAKKRTRFLGFGGAGAGADGGRGGGGVDVDPEDRIEAALTSDEQLRGVVFGDPAMHRMELYAARIETLAVAAVTGRGGGG